MHDLRGEDAMSANVSNGTVVTAFVVMIGLLVAAILFVSDYLGNRAYFQQQCVEERNGIVIEDRSGDLICLDSATVIWP